MSEKHPVLVRVPRDIKEQIGAVCIVTGVKQNEFINRAIVNEIARVAGTSEFQTDADNIVDMMNQALDRAGEPRAD